MRVDLASILGRWNKTEELKTKAKVPTNYGAMPQKGQVIKGQIIDIQQSRVTVLLEDGQVVDAKMSEKFDFVIGDQLSFVVKDSNQEQLLLTPVLEGNPEESKIIDILKGAGLPETEKNIEIVNKLIENNLPINKKTLTEMSMFSKRFPEAKVEQLVFLMKNDIMISKESIHYVSELLKNKINMNENLSTFNTGVADIVDKASGALVVETILKENDSAINIFTKIKNFFLKPEDQQPIPKENLDVPLSKFMTSSDTKGLVNNTTELVTKLLKESSSESLTPKGDEAVLVKPATTGLTSSLEGFVLEKGKAFSDLFSTVENLDIPDDIKDATNKLLAQRVTKSMLNNELMMHKEDLTDADKINKHYNKVYTKIMDVLNLNIQDTSESVQKVLKEAASIKTNMEMMNQLQQNHQFFHIPLNLNDRDINSELYIMNNKNSKKSSDERITALIRLDLRNLGHLDIYVAKTAQNVEVTFYVDKDETKNDISDHTMELTNKLVNASFQVLGIGVLMKEKEFNIFEDFFEPDDGSDSKRFTFDMRA